MFFSCILGCADKSDSKGSEVLLEINDRKLTRSAYERLVDTRLALAEIVSSGKNFKRNRGKLEKSIRNGIGDFFIQESLMLGEAETYFAGKGGKIDENIRSRVRKDMQERFSVKGSKLTFQDVVEKLGKAEQESFLETFENEVKIETFLQSAYSNELVLSDIDIEKGLKRLEAYNITVRATNDLMFARATNVWKMALSGGNFAQLADKYSEDKDKKPGGDIGECSKVDFSDDEETWNEISGLKEGWVSPPLKTYSGVEIFKVERKIPAKESNSGEDSLHLRRIMFRRGVEVQEYTADEYKKEIEGTRRNKRMRTILVQAWKRCSLRFPAGRKALPVSKWSRMRGFPNDKERKEPMK